MDKHALAVMVRDKRQVDRLSMADVQREIGVGRSTLSRIERAVGAPQSETLLRVANWLKTPVERFYASKTATEERSINRITAVIMGDEDLSPDDRHKLAVGFRNIYLETLELTAR